MATAVPAICTEFLERMQDAFLYISGKHPDLRVEREALHPVGRYAVAIRHPLAKDLRWTFRFTDDASGRNTSAVCNSMRAFRA